MDFSLILKKLRLNAGMTQLDLADKLGVSAAAVGAWENGRAKPRLDKLTQLADLLSVPVSYLTDAEAPPLVGSSSSLQKISGGGPP